MKNGSHRKPYYRCLTYSPVGIVHDFVLIDLFTQRLGGKMIQFVIPIVTLNHTIGGWLITGDHYYENNKEQLNRIVTTAFDCSTVDAFIRSCGY